MICQCGATFRRLHPEINVCRCGISYDGSGNAIEGKPAKLERKSTQHPQLPKPVENVGTALAEAIPTWAIANKEGCGCRDFERKMNAWGIAGCEGEHYDEIIEHLVKQTDNLIPLFRKIPETGRRISRRGCWIRRSRKRKNKKSSVDCRPAYP